jgi:hypothetical protein
LSPGGEKRECDKLKEKEHPGKKSKLHIHTKRRGIDKTVAKKEHI